MTAGIEALRTEVANLTSCGCGTRDLVLRRIDEGIAGRWLPPYDEAKRELAGSLSQGVDVGDLDLTAEQVEVVAAWLAGEGHA